MEALAYLDNRRGVVLGEHEPRLDRRGSFDKQPDGGILLDHKQIRSAHPAASDVNFQNQVLDACARLTGVELPSAVAP